MSTLITTIKYLATDIILDIITFPAWWYSQGLITAAKRFVRHLKTGLQFTGLKVWILSIFKPMFNDTSLQGRLVSVVMRFIFLILKTIIFSVWLIISTIIFLLWLALPPFVIYMIIQQLV